MPRLDVETPTHTPLHRRVGPGPSSAVQADGVTMLHTPLLVRPSEYGHGTFAATPIPAGTLIWTGEPDDPTVLSLSQDQVTMMELIRFPARRWATKNADGTWLLAIDGSQFMNHRADADPDANTVTCRACGAVSAVRDISEGEEVRCDYTVDDHAVADKVDGLVLLGGADAVPCANPGCPARH